MHAQIEVGKYFCSPQITAHATHTHTHNLTLWFSTTLRRHAPNLRALQGRAEGVRGAENRKGVAAKTAARANSDLSRGLAPQRGLNPRAGGAQRGLNPRAGGAACTICIPR
jgi:hypothetical protein